MRLVNSNYRDGSGCLSFYQDKGHRLWIQHRRIDHGDDEYLIRNKQVRNSEIMGERNERNQRFQV